MRRCSHTFFFFHLAELIIEQFRNFYRTNLELLVYLLSHGEFGHR